MTWTLHVHRSDIASVDWRETPSQPIEDGQVRLEVVRFGLSANNVTYATLGTALQYWEFFPTDDPATGCVPVWGYAMVAESRCDEVPVGRRVYGYLPFASDVVVAPSRVRADGFADGSEHRAELPAAYNAYTLVEERDRDAEAYEALLRPLFVTSMLIADQLAEEDFFGAEAVLVSSASSKTAYGTAYALRHTAGPAGETRREVVGLTPAERVDATAALDLYDRVLAYDDIATLDADRPTVYVDISGSYEIRAAVHRHCADLRYDCAVGLTHRDDTGDASDLPGPEAVFFFAPSEWARQASNRGREEQARRVDEGVEGFVQRASDLADPLMTLRWVEGRDEAAEAWRHMVEGQTGPSEGVAVSL